MNAGMRHRHLLGLVFTELVRGRHRLLDEDERRRIQPKVGPRDVEPRRFALLQWKVGLSLVS